MAAARKGKVDTIADIEIAGFPGKEYMLNSEGFSIRGRVVMRGSRPYTYFVIGDKRKFQERVLPIFLSHSDLWIMILPHYKLLDIMMIWL